MRGRVLLGATAVVGILLLAACGGDNGSSSPATTGASSTTGAPAAKVVDVVTTTTQITDFVRNIGGDQVRIYAVLKANVDPHDYEPTPADLDAIAKADVIVRTASGLEKWFGDTIRSAGPKGPSSTPAGRHDPQRRPRRDEPEGDPHIWHNPQNAKIMVANIAHAFEAVDPAATPALRGQPRRLLGPARRARRRHQGPDRHPHQQEARHQPRRLRLLRRPLRPRVRRARSSRASTRQAELSPADINDLVAKIKAQGVKAVFSESSLPPKTAEAIASEAGVKVVAGDDALYGDTPRSGGQRRRHLPRR